MVAFVSAVVAAAAGSSSDHPQAEEEKNSDYFFACSGGEFDTAKILLEKDPSLAHATTKNGEHCLHLVAISGGGDNVGDFQEALGERLEQALRAGQPVPVWVNPSHPADAVIDRSLRPGLLAFKMVFVLVFGAVGIGLLVFTWRSRPETTAPSGNADPSPWLARREWAHNQIRSNKRLSISRCVTSCLR